MTANPGGPDNTLDDIRVVSGNPTPDELAAVIAVLETMAQERQGAGARATAGSKSAWTITQRPTRTAIIRGSTLWRSFP